LVGRSLKFAWLVENYDAIYAKNPGLFSSTISDLLDDFAESSFEPVEISELEAFLANHEADLGSGMNIFWPFSTFMYNDLIGGFAAVATLNDDIDRARGNKLWVENNFVTISLWLNEEMGSRTPPTPPGGDLAKQQSDAFELNIDVNRPVDPVLGEEARLTCILDSTSTIEGSTCRFESSLFSEV
jgi:hypothetical protein